MGGARILPYVKTHGPSATVADLAAAHRRAERRRALTGLALIAPLALFLTLCLLLPIALMLARGVQERELPAAWPKTAEAMRRWDGQRLPDDRAFAMLAAELEQSRDTGALSAVANRLNYGAAGYRSLLLRTARALPLPPGASARQGLAAIDPRWAELKTWSVIKQASGPASSFYLLAALDRRLDERGRIVRVADERAVFVDVLGRTAKISAVVTLACLILGYPLAYGLARATPGTANLLMIFVLLPFWTSVLVRSSAWAVLLQSHGVINDVLTGTGLTAHPLPLIYNRAGVYIAMTHVLLPFLVLPLYGVMKGVPPNTRRAALSLGAAPTAAFLRVYLPQTLPGVVAGCLLVFVLALGYYVTPALVGGARDQMISAFIAFYTSQSLNWGMAAALCLLLLAPALILMLVYSRIAGANALASRR